MFKDQACARRQPELVPVAELVKDERQLAVCKTAAELMDLKPNIGAVTIGGNQVGRQHSLSDKTNLKAVLHASYVANVCFVNSTGGSQSSDTLYLSHAATVEDIKRSFYELHKSRVTPLVTPSVAATSASGLQGAMEKEQLAWIICRDVDGRILVDQDKLPTATCTACSDVGYHAQFFLDFSPPSMQRNNVKKEINVSAAAIDSFVKTPGVLGALKDKPQEYPPQYAQMHGELHARLKTVTREVPAAISPDPLENAADEFRSILEEEEDEEGEKEGENCGHGSNLPLAFSHYASELAEAIESKSFDSLEGTLPEEAASHLLAVHPFVEELVRVQTSSEWTNYDTETDHADGLKLFEIAEMLEEQLLESVKMHEDIALCKENTREMDPAEVKEIENECSQLEDIFKALHRTFEETSEKQSNLSDEMERCKRVCDEHLDKAKHADARYKTMLTEERRNLDALKQLDSESKLLHEMTLQQIKFCSDQVEYSHQQTSMRMRTIDTEIQRLQDLQRQETDRLQRLAECKNQIGEVEEEEKTRAEKSSRERALALSNARERVNRSEKGVESSKNLLWRLETLYKDVKEEFADALAYGTEVRKAIGVDCHAAFLGHGKFLSIQREKAQKSRDHFQKEREAKLQTWTELTRLQIPGAQATVDRANAAKRELEEAEGNVQQLNKTIQDTNDKIQALVEDFSEVETFLKQHASPSTDGRTVVKALPMARCHLAIECERVNCCNVAEFRDQRCKTTAIGHPLESLKVFETDFARRYKGEAASNVRAMFTFLNAKFGRLIGQ